MLVTDDWKGDWFSYSSCLTEHWRFFWFRSNAPSLGWSRCFRISDIYFKFIQERIWQTSSELTCKKNLISKIFFQTFFIKLYYLFWIECEWQSRLWMRQIKERIDNFFHSKNAQCQTTKKIRKVIEWIKPDLHLCLFFSNVTNINIIKHMILIHATFCNK